MTVGERLKTLRIERKMTQQALGAALGVKQAAVRKYEYDEINIPQSKLAALSDIFGVSIDYLIGKTAFKNSKDEYLAEKNLNGAGFALRPADEPGKVQIMFPDGLLMVDYNEVGPELAKRQGRALADYLNQLRRENEQGFEKSPVSGALTRLPFFSAPVSAGTGQWLSDGHEYEYEEFENVPCGADFALRVRGDSMEPLYADGEIVFVKSNVIVESGQIGVFCLNDEGYLKMLQGSKLVSINPKYTPIAIGEFDSYFCAGRVIGKTSGRAVREPVI